MPPTTAGHASLLSVLSVLCASAFYALNSSLPPVLPPSKNPVSYANRLPFSCRLINRLQNNHVPMPLPPIRRHALLRQNRPSKRIQFRRNFIHHLEFLLEPLPANLPRQPPLFIKRKSRRQASPPLRPLHIHRRGDH